jgi:hypothetical protein
VRVTGTEFASLNDSNVDVSVQSGTVVVKTPIPVRPEHALHHRDHYYRASPIKPLSSGFIARRTTAAALATERLINRWTTSCRTYGVISQGLIVLTDVVGPRRITAVS